MEKSSYGCGSLFLGVSFLSFKIFKNFKNNVKKKIEKSEKKMNHIFRSAAFGVLSELVYLISTCFSSHSTRQEVKRLLFFHLS